MDWTQWILTAAAFIVAVGGAAGYLTKLMKPFKELSQRVERVERHDKEDMERFKAIEENFKRTEKADQALYKAISAMLNTTIDGNSKDKLKAARDALNEHIIEN